MSNIKRFKRWSPKGRRLAWARSRAQVERLEARVLLSAEPMLQQSRPDTDAPIAAGNVTLEVAPRESDLLEIADIAQGSTRIDLTKAGRGAGQSSQLAGSGDLLTLNASLASLVLDLGAGDDQVVLTQQPDGKLKLSGGDDLINWCLLAPRACWPFAASTASTR